MSARLLLCLILLCASFPLMARDVRMMDANGAGGGSCQDQDDDDLRRGEPAAQPATRKPATHVAKPAKSASSPSHGGADFDDVRPPRWHSFLPGMFR